MEPMTLGSPVGSPVNPGPSSPMSPFLPSFLMGDPISSGSRSQQPTPMGSRSPSRLARHVSISTPTQPPPTDRTPMHTPASEKPSGPPTRGLFDTLDTYTPQSPLTINRPTNDTPGLYTPSYPEPSQPPGAHNWVTVFGFPPSSAAAILSQFGRYGTVVETRQARRGNWAHVRYGSAAEARRAIAKNGKVFGDCVMVGVVPCTDIDVIGNHRQAGKENVSQYVAADSSFMSPQSFISTPTMRGKVSCAGTPLGYASPLNVSSTMSPSRARPVGQAYANAKHSTEVAMMRHTPQKSTGLVNKAWELLGW